MGKGLSFPHMDAGDGTEVAGLAANAFTSVPSHWPQPLSSKNLTAHLTGLDFPGKHSICDGEAEVQLSSNEQVSTNWKRECSHRKHWSENIN